jgi:hypothetical protein
MPIISAAYPAFPLVATGRPIHDSGQTMLFRQRTGKAEYFDLKKMAITRIFRYGRRMSI